jgi:hypothetical protein
LNCSTASCTHVANAKVSPDDFLGKLRMKHAPAAWRWREAARR